MLLIEMQCNDWKYNKVNAGIVELCSKVFRDKPIKLYDEEKHTSNLVELI